MGLIHQVLTDRFGNHILIAKDEYTTGVFVCDTEGKVIFPGERLLKTHLSYEENHVAHRHILGKMQEKSKREKNSKVTTYFGATEIRVKRRLELPDDHKVYDDELEQEHIYADEENYPVDGTKHLLLGRRSKFLRAMQQHHGL